TRDLAIRARLARNQDHAAAEELRVARPVRAVAARARVDVAARVRRAELIAAAETSGLDGATGGLLDARHVEPRADRRYGRGARRELVLRVVTQVRTLELGRAARMHCLASTRGARRRRDREARARRRLLAEQRARRSGRSCRTGVAWW